MREKVYCAIILFTCFTTFVFGQMNNVKLFHDDANKISFQKIGSVEKSDSSTYVMVMQVPEHSLVQSASTEISLTNKLFVDLPGSYGGRFFYDATGASTMMENKISTDQVIVNNKNYTRDYWIAYAGMGMWEAVLNCYSQDNGTYCVVSLIQTLPIGKPGEEINGIHMTSETLKEKIFQSYQDPNNIILKQFNALLSSIQIQSRQ